jgi:hypothetical protein
VTWRKAFDHDGLRWEAIAPQRFGCFIDLGLRREEAKAVSPLRSATALHTLDLPWTAVSVLKDPPPSIT